MDSIFLPSSLRTVVDQSRPRPRDTCDCQLPVASQMNKMNEIEGEERGARVLRSSVDLGERVSERVLTRNVEGFALGN